MTIEDNKSKFSDIEDSVLFVVVRKTYQPNMTKDELLDVTCRWWKMKGTRKNKAKYALAIYKNKVKGVFTILSWNENKEVPGKWEFVGEIAPPSAQNRYMDMSVQKYRKQGASTPFMYINC